MSCASVLLTTTPCVASRRELGWDDGIVGAGRSFRAPTNMRVTASGNTCTTGNETSFLNCTEIYMYGVPYYSSVALAWDDTDGGKYDVACSTGAGAIEAGSGFFYQQGSGTFAS